MPNTPSTGVAPQSGRDPKTMRFERDSGACDLHALLGYLAHSIDLGCIADGLRKGKQFVVDVPVHVQAGLKSGRYSMLHGEDSGKTWATIVEKIPGEKDRIVANCPIHEEAVRAGNPLKELSGALVSLQLQQQMAALAELLGETYDAILRVEAGQRADRIGQLYAGRDGLLFALKVGDAQQRALAIATARGSLLEAQGKLGEVLRQLVEGFQPVMPSAPGRFLQEVFSRGFTDRQDDAYNLIVDYYEAYMQATQLIALSFIVCGEEESARAVYDASRRFFGGLDYRNVLTAFNAHADTPRSEHFYYQIEGRLDADLDACLELARPCDRLEIPLEGSACLEVLENVRSEAPAET